MSTISSVSPETRGISGQTWRAISNWQRRTHRAFSQSRARAKSLSRRAMLRARDREIYRRLSVNSLDAYP